MHKLVARVSALVLLSLAPAALGATDYTLSFEPGGKTWSVEARLDGRGEDALDFRFALWTPGAYHVADFGRFVTELTAADEKGAALAVERLAPGHFAVRGAKAAKEIVIRYTADAISDSIFSKGLIDVEANRIARNYAYVNSASLFGFVPARQGEPTRLAVKAPEGWRTATVMEVDEAGRYLAPSWLRLEDSPLLFSPTLESADFTVDGKPHRVSVHGRAADETRKIAAGCERIVKAGSALMRGLPYDRYHFLYAFADEAMGSGLEHSFSTLILVNSSTKTHDRDLGFWGITAHEFFHLWCAERMHVQAIREPDVLSPLVTGTIWLNEGVTEYFCRHLLLHAGFHEPEDLLATYVGDEAQAIGSAGGSWTDVSRNTAKWDGMQDIMEFAGRMYGAGPPTIFALDMTMRRATEGERGVLDLLHHLQDEYVAEGRGFAEDELDDVLLEIGEEPARDFYARHIDGAEAVDPASFLDVIGYRLDDGEVEELDGASEAQLRARRDYFSLTGSP